MIRLILSEVKKVFKNKINILMILCVCGFMTYTTWDCYHEEPIIPLKTFEGKKLTKMNDVYRYTDKIISKYEGVATEETWNQFCDDYNAYYDQFTKEVDDEIMIKIYGNNYKELFEEVSKNLNVDRYFAIENQYGENIHKYMGTYAGIDYDSETKTAALPIVYKHQDELNMLNFIYLDSYETISYKKPDIRSYKALPLYVLSHKEDNIKSLEDAKKVYLSQNENALIDIESYNKFIEDKIHHTTFYFGGTASLNPLYTSLSRFSFLNLIPIAIILANIFSIEKKTKVDQIIVPTREGPIKIAIAKVCAGLTIGLFTTLLQLFCIFAIAYLTLKPTGMHLPEYALGTGYSFNPSMISGIYTNNAFIIGSQIQMLLLGTFAIIIFTVFLSSITKNQFVTIIIVLLFIYVPFYFQSGEFDINQIIYPCFYMYTSGTSPISIGSQIFYLKDISTILWLSIAVIFSIIIFIQAKIKYVSNR